MILGSRLKEIREHKNLSQGDIEKISGLKRCYISRVENGHTVPAIETLEKMANALAIPMYRLFYTGEESLAPLWNPAKNKTWGDSGRPRRYLARLALALQKMTPDNRELIMTMAHRVTRRTERRTGRKRLG